MKDKKQKIHAYTEAMLNNSYKIMVENIQKALNSGAIDIENWDENINPMILPKSIVTAILENESTQYLCEGTCFEKEIKRESKNLKLFL